MEHGPIKQLHVQTGHEASKPTPLSPMCGWQKVETSSPKKISTPTKKWTRCVEPITPSVQKELLPMCYLSDESPTKLSDSGHVTETSDDLSDDNLLYFKVPDVKLTDLYDWAKKVNECKVTTVNPAKGLIMQKSSSGSTVEVNDELIALFRYDEAVYAVLERCPHAGGPLHLGDIEVLPETSSVCVTCPWHKWKIDLSNGHVISPQHHNKRRAQVFLSRVDENQSIWIGFSKFSAQYFNLSTKEEF